MEIKTEEISLEELNENIVEYVLTSPHNTNPAILRQMLNSRGISGGGNLKKNIIFSISSPGEDLGDEYNGNAYLVDVITNEAISPEQLAKITLSGTGFFADQNYTTEGIEIDGKFYSLGQILGFSISSGLRIVTLAGTGLTLNDILIDNPEYKQAYFDALKQEITNA